MTGTSTIQQQQEVDGLISQARVEYGKVCVSQHELGTTLLKLRDATKAQGNRAGKGFEACLAEIGISKTQAYRFMRAAETGQPVDYDNETIPSENGHRNHDFVSNGTKLVPLADAELADKGDEQSQLFDKGHRWDEHWQGMPEFVQDKQQPFAKLIVRFRNQEDLDDFARLIGQKLNRKSQCTWHPELKRGELGNSGKRYVDES